MDGRFPGSFRLFRAFGINVFLHWTWFILAAMMIPARARAGMGLVPALLVYVALFGIVLLHEFGHALACRSVGGQAQQIVLWPLGGIAFVSPPPRPGAVLWSIVAGPLVNLILIPVTLPLVIFAWAFGDLLPAAAVHVIYAIVTINVGLLVFNLLPVYPLDGGQILQAILWFRLGRARSLQIAATVGLVVALVGGLAALLAGFLWLTIIAVFVGMQSYQGLRYARYLAWQQETGIRW